MNAAIGMLVLVVVTLNVAVTVWISKTDFLLPNQKLAQSLVVWLVPVLGAIGIAVFLVSNRERPHQRSHHIPDERDEWVGGSGRSSHDGD
jgi:hypothetical protein